MMNFVLHRQHKEKAMKHEITADSLCHEIDELVSSIDT